MVKFLSLSSGSNGNSYFFGNDDCGLLVDAGIGIRTLKQRLEKGGIGLDAVRMILVTHDHTDHVRGLASVAKRLSVPIYATSVLHNALMRRRDMEGVLDGCKRILRPGMEMSSCGFAFTAFEVPHDATQTLGYNIVLPDGKKVVMMTDLGRVPMTAMEYCREADYVIIESNYDMDMLIHGSYPPELKARVMSDSGHLCNELCGSVIREFLHPGLKEVFLCHLSNDNNTPEIALKTVYSYIAPLVGTICHQDFDVVALPRADVYSRIL